eukprot:scaffold14780_cov102-Skeletonema_dohrnii-CCMP3373.AAC.3
MDDRRPHLTTFTIRWLQLQSLVSHSVSHRNVGSHFAPAESSLCVVSSLSPGERHVGQKPHMKTTGLFG